MKQACKNKQSELQKNHGLWDSEIFIVQSHSRQDLVQSIQGLIQFLSGSSEIDLKDLAYTLNCPLQESGYRLAVIADSPDTLEKKLSYAHRRLSDSQCMKIKDRSGIFFFEKPLSHEGSLAFLFPGEGSQYVNMFSDLCLHFPEVKSCFDRADQAFLKSHRDIVPSRLLFPSDCDPSGFKPSGADSHCEEEIWQMDLAVISVFAANHAMSVLLDRLEIRPQAVLGHSSGEFAALLASGVILDQNEDHIVDYTLEAVDIIQSMEKQIPEAKLVAFGNLDSNTMASMIEASYQTIYLAMDNCPHQKILCVPNEAFPCFLEMIENKGAFFNILPFQRAYHTPLFQPITDRLSGLFNHINMGLPHTRLYSCSVAQPVPQDSDEIRQLAAGQWSQPVRFRESIEAMYDDGVRIFIEVGPKNNLSGFVDDILQDRSYLAVPSNVSHRTGISQLHHLIGLLVAHGVNMNLEYLYHCRGPKDLSFENVLEDDNCSRPASLRDQIMLDYLQTMEHFIETQTEVMTAFMTRGRSK